MSDADPITDGGDADLDALYEHLVATEVLPIERETGHWLGEAQAVAADLRDRDADAETRRERLATVVDLLDEFESTENSDADDHVARAREIADLLRERAVDEAGETE